MNKHTQRQPSRVVFIGNIAYDASKEQLINVFKEVGPILNFRMVTERESNKPRGFAFCEYKDEASAMSAIRNLTGREVNGRPLRVDFADNKSINMPGDDGDVFIDTHFGNMPPQQAPPKSENNMKMPSSSNKPSKPYGSGYEQQGLLGPPPPSSTTQDVHAPPMPTPLDPIMAALAQVPRQVLMEALAQMKQISMTDPEKARHILTTTPMLAVVMLHMQYMLGFTNKPFITTGAPQPTPVSAPPPHMMDMHGSGGLLPPPNMPQPPPYAQQQPPQPAAANSQQVIQHLLKMITPQQLQTILSLTPAQIEKLPPGERQQALMIQQNMKVLAKDMMPQLNIK